ncbi:MAG: 2-succinyl-6-hydroxy-2,4-cyclohexadiene-1-carboxylate synthase [Balneolaceae bacterium]|nr:2-succinyl-6-hydroxy-2,4-cyclohexadiene-1-carboxylate synthase [Balneolaceae bacterium]
MKLLVDHIRYDVTVYGENPSLPYLLMLHGFMGSSELFEHLLPELQSCCNPVTLDLLGHGETDRSAQAGRYATGSQVSDLEKIIKRLDRKPIYLYGYSMGGRLALQFALEHSGTLAGLILESANPGLRSPKARADRRESDNRMAAAIEADFPGFLEEWERLPLFNNEIGLPEIRARRLREVQQRQNPKAMADSLRHFGTGRMPPAWDRLEQLTLPVLLLAGSADADYCTICRNMHKLISRSRVRIIEKAGHRVHQENPAELVEHIGAFVKPRTGGSETT